MTTDQIFAVYLRILTNDFLRYFLFAGPAFLIFWVLIRKRLEHRFIQEKFPRAARLWHEFRYSLSTCLIFALNGLGIYWGKTAGYFEIYSDISVYGWLYFLLSIPLMLFLHDTYFYWTHRLMHHPKIYKHVHKVHHMSTNPSPWAAYSFHPLEALIQAFSLTFMLMIMPLHIYAIGIFLIYMIFRDVLGHLGFEFFPKGFTRNKWLRWHTTSTHHNLHHSKFNYNYGLYFSWWDDWMSTTHPDYDDIYDAVTERRANHAAK